MWIASTRKRLQEFLSLSLGLGLISAIATLVFFGWLADEVLEGETRHFDDVTRAAVHTLATPALTTAMRFISFLGSALFLTAATIFVVAAIGMAVGGGLYVPAVLATLIALLALYTLGRMEARFQLKPLLVNYEVIGEDADTAITELNRILQDEQLGMTSVQIAKINGHSRVQFSVDAARQEQQILLTRLRQSTLLRSVNSLGQAEAE